MSRYTHLFCRTLVAAAVAPAVCFPSSSSSFSSSSLRGYERKLSSLKEKDFKGRLLSIAPCAFSDADIVMTTRDMNYNDLPVYRSSEVSKHTTKEAGVWVIYEDGVYDITKFIQNHPGGADKIILAAGKSVEPFWRVYRQHYNSKLPMEMLAPMRIGTLHPEDVAAENEAKDSSDPYFEDPPISPVLVAHSSKPINAEAPPNLLAHSYNTPNDLFFVRNHHPVPKIENAADHQISIDVATKGEDTYRFKLSDLKEIYPKKEVVAAIQCGGNRRKEMNPHGKTAGTAWDIGAISNAQWSGVSLRDVLASLGYDEDYADAHNIKHIQFESEDGMTASVPIDVVLNRRSQVLLAFEMNEEELPPAHGFPVRVVVPGHVGVRNVKWVNRIILSDEESKGPWQRGMAYKGFGPSIKTLDGIDPEKIHSVQQMGVQSAMFGPTQLETGVSNTINGFAYSGGGKGIVRVDVSIDGGETWKTATLTDGSEQDMDKAYAWTFWEADFEIPESWEGKKVEVVCKATDAHYNVQPDSVKGVWNLRGINNNAWHRINMPVVQSIDEEE